MNGVRRLACLGVLAALAAAAATGGGGDEPADGVLRRFADEFVRLTPGDGKFPASFRMGTDDDGPEAEKPRVAVTIRRPFAVAKYEVTQELYEAVAGRNPSRWKGPRNSVEMVSWDEAGDFCCKATALLRERKLLPEGEVVRLPSEAEWEYACRAGTTTAYCFGDRAADLGAYAWFKGNSPGEDPPVGKKKPNAWGLYDMHGYVWEWCADAWADSHRGAAADGSPRADRAAKERVVRGGSWNDDAAASRSASRAGRPSGYRGDAVGFRCVRTAPFAKDKEERR
jgi:formylglycine-generating enzyme required for sulfatase activity